MKKVIASALAAVTFGGAVVASAAPAAAQPYRHYYGGGHYYRHGGGDAAGAAAIAGIAGLAIGAAIAGNNHSHSYYRNSYYDGGYGYYGRPYGYYAPRTCISQERVWDPYIGHHVYVERRYPC